jgi:integrase
MSLTNTYVNNLKASKKLKRHPDGMGLYLTVAVSGSKIWEHRCYFQSKETYLVIGNYPELSILDARQIRDKNKQLIKKGVHPKDIKNLLSNQKTTDKTFEEVFDEWHSVKMGEWSEDYAIDVRQRASRYLLPFIGHKSISDIESPVMIKLLKDIDTQGLIDTLEKVRGIASRVFSYAVGMGIIAVNPVRDLPDVFKKKKNKHYATITNPKDIQWLLRTIDGHRGSHQVRTCLILAPHLFLRPGEITGLTWKEIEFESKLIRLHGDRMKMNKDHLVPMSTQVYKILSELREIKTDSDYVFPSPRNKNKCITTNALLVSLRTLGINKEQFTTHGFRHMASTRLNEMGFNSDVIERQLSHTESNKVKAAYNHAEHLDKRVDMMRQWSDYLDKLKYES